MTLGIKKDCAIHLLILALLGILAYAGTLEAPLLNTEVRDLLTNPAIPDFSRVNDIVRVDQIFNGSLPKLTFAVNHLWGGFSPAGYHWVNLLIHLAVGLALYWVVREWLSLLALDHPLTLKWLPGVTAALHLLSPLNSQAVILISNRPLLLASLFYVLTFGFLSRFLRVYRENQKKAKGSVDLLMVMACLAAGGTCHPILVTLPFMAWIFYRFTIPSQKFEFELFGMALVPWMMYLFYQFSTPEPVMKAQMAGKSGGLPLLYFLSEIKAFCFYYLPKALFPMHLSIDPGFKLVSGLGDWSWMLALLTLIALMALIRATRSRLAHWAFLWTLLIFVSFYSVGLDDPVAYEPRFYLPGIGVHLLLAMGLIQLGIRHPIAGWLRFGIPVLLLILTFGRGQDYQSEITLWEETARSSPHKPRVHYELASAYLDNGSLDKAEHRLITALELNPKYRPALIDMGKVYLDKKDYPKALDSFTALIQQGGKNPPLLFLTGQTLLKMKQPEKAIPYLEEAVEKVSGAPIWHNALARAYHQVRRLRDAEKRYRISLQISPDQSEIHNELGKVYWEQKSFYFADASFEKAYQLDNQSVDVLNNLVSSSMLFQDYDKAMMYLDRLLKIDPENHTAQQMRVAAQRLQKQKKANPPPPTKSIH